MSTISKIPKIIGPNKINTAIEFDVILEARDITNDVRMNIKKYIDRIYLNKGLGLKYILQINYEPIFKNELPLLSLENISPTNPIYPYKITLECECLYFNINQEIKGNISIEHGEIPEVIVYNNYIRCNINKTPNMQVNISDKTITINNKSYSNYQECIVKIENLRDSTGVNKIIAEGILIEDEDIY